MKRFLFRLLTCLKEPSLVGTITLKYTDVKEEAFVCVYDRGGYRYATLTDNAFKEHGFYKKWVQGWIHSGDVYFLKHFTHIENDFMVRELKRRKRILEVVDV